MEHTGEFSTDAFVGLDQAQPLLKEFEDTLYLQLWQEASDLFCGGGLDQGADWLSYRSFIASLLHAKRGRQLSELMVTIATGGY
eukprot:9188770-Pyramimonas_sp.AAC.1